MGGEVGKKILEFRHLLLSNLITAYNAADIDFFREFGEISDKRCMNVVTAGRVYRARQTTRR